jgi:hypothetical protein
VATPADEAAWLALAQRVTARELAREVRAVDAGAVEGGALDAEGEEGDGSAGVVVRCAPRVQGLFHRARWLARRAAGEELPTWACMEAVAAEVLSALPLEVEPEGAEAGAEEETGPPAAPRAEEETERPAAPRARAANGCAPQGARENHAAGARAIAGADAFELDARLRRAVALEQRLEAELAPLVLAVAEGGLHRARGFGTLDAWARERLGIAPRKLRALLRLARAARRWPALFDAFRAGRLSWVQAHAVLPALAVAPSPAAAREWVERAAALSVRRLREVVDAARLGSAAPEAGERQTGAPRSTAAEEVPETERFFFSAPRPVAALFRAVLCSMRRHLERTTGRLPTEGEAAGRMFEHAIATWEASAHGGDRRLARAHRVFARDGWRCTVPGCTSYRNLHDHHVRFRSAGGSDALANRTTLCAFHHLRGVHAGRIRVSGRAPGALRFELGLRPGAPPLVRYEPGERLGWLASGPPVAPSTRSTYAISEGRASSSAREPG